MSVFYFCVNAFETSDCVLSEEAADRITDRHLIREEGIQKSIFCSRFPLEDMLKAVAWYTWEENSEYAILLDTGYRRGHGIYRLYVFDMGRMVGWDPMGVPTTSMAVYYAEPVIGERWQIVTAYPWSKEYDDIFCALHNITRLLL